MSTSVPPVEEIEEAAVSDNLDELNDIILPETNLNQKQRSKKIDEVEEVVVEEPEVEEMADEQSADVEPVSDV